jgi:hypothetical protein
MSEPAVRWFHSTGLSTPAPPAYVPATEGAEDIVEEGKSWGVRALKGYLQYARTGSAILPKPSQSDCDSEFEEWVLRALRANGFDAVPQLGFAGYRLDLAVRHPQASWYIPLRD